MHALAHRLPRLFVFVVLGSVVFLLASCAHQPIPPAHEGLPGFWLGLLHGFLIMFSFAASLFTHARIYAFPNSGGWYDFGYLLGVAMFFGGGGRASSH